MIKVSEIKIFSVRPFRLLPFAFCLLTSNLFSQPNTYVAVYGGNNYDRGQSIQQTFDKGYIVCGPTSSYGMGNTDVYLLKIDSTFKLQWQKTFGGANIENCLSVRQTNDSGFVICGYTNSFGLGGYDAYLIKTDSTGNLQWEKTYGGTDWDFGNWAEQTKDGGYILAGETYSFGNNSQFYLVKTNAVGDLEWQKNFGDTSQEASYEVHQTPDSGYVLAGNTTSDNGDKDFYLVKTNSAGSKLWEKSYGSTSADSCSSVALCKDGGILLGGSELIGGKLKKFFLKTDSIGNVLMLKVDTNSAGNKYISRIRETKDGNIIMAVNADVGGFGGKEIHLIQWNFGDWFPWGRTLGGTYNEEAYDLIQTADSGFAVAGYTSTFGTGPDNIFIVKTNTIGAYNSTVNSYVGTNEIEEENNNTLIYPNPFTESVFIKTDVNFFSPGNTCVFSISDLCGREIHSATQSANPANSLLEIKIPKEYLTQGFYFVSLRSGNKIIHKKLLFVR